MSGKFEKSEMRKFSSNSTICLESSNKALKDKWSRRFWLLCLVGEKWKLKWWRWRQFVSFLANPISPRTRSPKGMNQTEYSLKFLIYFSGEVGFLKLSFQLFFICLRKWGKMNSVNEAFPFLGNFSRLLPGFLSGK